MPFSLLIIVRNRRQHLENVLRAVSYSTVRPEEIIVVHMNEPAYEITGAGTVRHVELHTAEKLPLARARNTAARAARYDTLVFLDVDCLPEPRCFETLIQDLDSWQLSMVDPRYLRSAVPDGPLDFRQLQEDSRVNPARRGIPYGLSADYGLFWSLGFAVSRTDFETIGGFDEAYIGYGAEDTDFAFTAQQAGISLGFSRALAYHQNHPSYDPPLNWLADIVTNANYFYKKWHKWAMRKWLDKFAELGYVRIEPDHVTLLKLPTETEIAACLKRSPAD